MPQARSDNQLVYTSINQLCYAGSNNTAACTSPPSGSLPYTYDAGDNLTKMGAAFQTFNNADQLCWTGSTSGTCSSPPSGVTRYAYDTRGNRVTVTPPSGGPTTLAYDQANRLVGYGSTATYAYNGDGLRMSKTISGSTTQFLWDLSRSIPVLLKDGPVQYVYGPGGSPLEQISGSTVLWLHHDQLGSTRLVTDTSGSNKATYSFDAYGNLTSTTGTITNPFRFAGEYRDAESGLLHLRARYYDPSTGQFISRDPAVALTRQPYSYGYDNPLNMTDPTGLLGWDDVKHLGGMAAGAAANIVGNIHDNLTSGDPARVGLGVAESVGIAAPIAAGVFFAGGGALVAAGLDALGSGAATVAGMPVAAGALPKLADLATRFGTDQDTVAGSAIYNGTRYVDTANGGNINCLFQYSQSSLLRVTLDPSSSRIISAGIMRANSLINGIARGRFQ